MILLKREPIIQHHHPSPQPWDRKRKKNMTAVVGFCCSDGIVISAETEESYGENDKAYSHKIFPLEREHCKLAVAGAGSGYLIDYANAQIATAIQSGITNSADFESQLRKILTQLYSRDFKHFPVNQNAELQIQLLVGAQFRVDSKWQEPVLFECRSNLVTVLQRHRPSCMLGAGELLKETARQFAAWGLDVHTAEWASVYLIHEAKHRYGGVGGKIHSITMENDGRFSYKRGFTEQESIIEAYSTVQQLLMLSLDLSFSDGRADDLVKSAITWLKNARRDLKNLERNKGKAKHTYIELRNSEMEKMMRQMRSEMRKAEELKGKQ
jgi:hypothetical protein